jgi:hypothetical protein
VWRNAMTFHRRKHHPVVTNRTWSAVGREHLQ